MDKKVLVEIEKAYCEYYHVTCRRCPIHNYRADTHLAYCYYAVSKRATPEEEKLFLDVARKEWRKEQNRFIGNAAKSLLSGKAVIL